jgi:asparagine synthase (glutamine-hydrolysing)
MCGIAGYWSRPGAPDRVPHLEAALRRLTQRGPDDRGAEHWRAGWGEVGLGHTRLSIIDLTAGGHQPMHSGDGRYSLVFNGEIYNYRELREELAAAGHVFRSQSDTEVLLAAWAAWGEACLPKLLGMFAFVVLDRLVGTLTCARDAFGIKPFYYAETATGFCFASELPAAVVLRGTGAALNLQRAYDYLAHGDYDSTDQTFIDGIRQLEPGKVFILELNGGRPGTSRDWWSPQVASVADIGLTEAASELRRLFLESVSQHLRSDVPLGAALSGGVDSSAVVCAMRHLEPDAPIHTFSFVAKDSPLSEEDWVDAVNAQVGATAHKVFVEPDELARDLDDMILAQGEPFGSTSIYAQYRIFKAAREAGITVTLDGQGADELLGGYNGYPGKRVHSLLDQGRLGDAASFLRRWTAWPGRPLRHGLKLVVADYVNGDIYQRLRQLAGSDMRPSWLDWRQLEERGVRLQFPRILPDDVPCRRLMAELAISASRRGLPALLRHADRNSMHFSVESRVPFLTTRLADFLFMLPEEYLISPQGETKHVFRKAMRGIVPDAVLDRRDKIGFATPEQQWLVHLGEQARDWLREDTGLDFLHAPHMLEAYDRMLSGVSAFSWQAWRWINFCRWHLTVFKPLAQLHPLART